MPDIGVPMGEPVGGGSIFFSLPCQGGFEDGVVVDASPVDDVGPGRRKQGDVNNDLLPITATKADVAVVGAVVGVVPAAAFQEDLMRLHQARGHDNLHQSMDAFVVRPYESVVPRATVEVMGVVA
jgi:hypothetical protein